MSKILKLMTILFMSFALVCCGDDEEEEMNAGEGADFSLGNLSRGKAALSVSGAESFEFDNATVVGSNVQVTIEGKEYNVLTIVMGESGNSQQLVSIGFYVPASDGTLPNNGNVPITFQLAAEDNTYAAVSIIGSDIYDSNTATSGSITISNSSSANNSFDAVFDLENISSFSDTSVDLEGAFRF